MQRGRRFVSLVLSLAGLATIAVGTGTASAAGNPPGRLFVISDSVLLSGETGIRNAFSDWQGVNVRGFPGIFTERGVEIAGESKDEIDDVVVVGLGYNYPFWDQPRFDRSIDQVMTAMLGWGAKHVVWVTMREIRPEDVGPKDYAGVAGIAPYYPGANVQLKNARTRWPQLVIADWAAVSHELGLSYDAIHLSPKGMARMGATIRQAVDGIGRAASGREVAVDIGSGATAAALNITTFGPTVGTYVVAYPCGTPRPATSSVNVSPGQTVANLAIVAVGANGKVCLYVHDDTHLVVDLFGVFDAGSFQARGPDRLVDTRGTGRVTPDKPLRVAVPGATGAAVVNLTVLDSATNAYATLYPCRSAAPATSTVNVGAGEAAAALTMVAVDGAGELCVAVSAPMQVIVDITGTLTNGFSSGTGASRLLDTRGAAAANGLRRVSDGAPGSFRVLTATADRSAAGYLTITSCTSPNTGVSNLNTRADVAVANAAIAPAADTCAYTDRTGHVIIDQVGTLDPSSGFRPVPPKRLLDTRANGVYAAA